MYLAHLVQHTVVSVGLTVYLLVAKVNKETGTSRSRAYVLLQFDGERVINIRSNLMKTK